MSLYTSAVPMCFAADPLIGHNPLADGLERLGFLLVPRSGRWCIWTLLFLIIKIWVS